MAKQNEYFKAVDLRHYFSGLPMINLWSSDSLLSPNGNMHVVSSTLLLLHCYTKTGTVILLRFFFLYHSFFNNVC